MTLLSLNNQLLFFILFQTSVRRWWTQKLARRKTNNTDDSCPDNEDDINNKSNRSCWSDSKDRNSCINGNMSHLYSFVRRNTLFIVLVLLIHSSKVASGKQQLCEVETGQTNIILDIEESRGSCK